MAKVGYFNPLQAYAYRRLLEEPKTYDTVHPDEMSYDYGKKPALTEAELSSEHLKYLRAVADYDSGKYRDRTGWSYLLSPRFKPMVDPRAIGGPSGYGAAGGVNYDYYNPHIMGTEPNVYYSPPDLRKVGYDMDSRKNLMAMNRFGARKDSEMPGVAGSVANALMYLPKKMAGISSHMHDPIKQLRYTFGIMDYDETPTQYIFKDTYNFNRYDLSQYIDLAKDEEGNLIHDSNEVPMFKYIGIEDSPLMSVSTDEIDSPITATRIKEMLKLHGWGTEKKAPNNLEFGYQFIAGGGLRPTSPLHLLGALHSPGEGYPVRIAVDKHPIHSVPEIEKKRRALDEISSRGLL